MAELRTVKVSGASRYTQDVEEVPTAIEVISQEQIVDRGYNDLSDLLKDIQGIDVSDNAGRFGEFYSVRGIAGNDRFLILINGQKLNPATGTFLSIGNSISIRYAKRVEVIFGPTSAVYGADAFSGIINIVFDSNTPDENRSRTRAHFNLGSFNSIDGGVSGNYEINENWSLNINARAFHDNGFNPIGADTIYQIIDAHQSPLSQGFDQPKNDHSIYFNLNYKNLSLNYYRQSYDEGQAMGFDPSIYLYTRENRWKTSTDMLWLDYFKELESGATLNFTSNLKYHLQDNNTAFFRWVTPFDTLGEPFKQYMTGIDRSIRNTLTCNHSLSQKFEFIIGLQHQFTSSIPPYGNDAVLGRPAKYTGSAAKEIADALTLIENRVAAFGQVVYSPVDEVDLIFGSRFDYSTRYKGVFNPRAGMIFRINSTSKLNFNYGRAFQPPSLFYLYEQFGGPVTVMISTREIQETDPSWQLRNQIVNSFELGLTQKISKHSYATFTAFYSDLKNLIERRIYTDSVYNKYADSFTPGLRNENIGVQKIAGIDFAFNSKLNKNIRFYANYSFIDAVSVDADGLETGIPRIGRHKAWTGLTASNLFNHLTISPRFKWVGQMHNFNAVLFEGNDQKGYTNLDLSISFQEKDKQLRLYATFENLLGYDIEHGGLFNQSVIYTATIPQPGLVFRFGLEVNVGD